MLTEHQLGYFARNGFLHARGLIDADTCDALVEHTWTRLPRTWSRSDPDTWTGSAEDSCHVADVRQRRGLFQFQKGDLLGNGVVDGAFSESAVGGRLARALMGRRLGKMKLRGLYCIVPLPRKIEFPPISKPHIESHPSQLIALCYLADVPLGGGGLLVWPGSHRELYPAMGSKLEHVRTPAYDAAFNEWARLEPVELPGRRGDIVIIHHRLLHAPNLNRSQKIRFGFLCDYRADDFKKLCTEKPSSNLWEDWPAIAALPAEMRDAPPDFVLERQKGLDVTAKGAAVPLMLPTENGTASSIKKADASLLARARQDGDTWIILSDDPKTIDDTELFPRGDDLSAAGISVLCDGVQVQPVCKYDIIAPIALSTGRHTIEVSNLDRRAWLRVLKIKLPFTRTEFLLQKSLGPGDESISFHA